MRRHEQQKEREERKRAEEEKQRHLREVFRKQKGSTRAAAARPHPEKQRRQDKQGSKVNAMYTLPLYHLPFLSRKVKSIGSVH